MIPARDIEGFLNYVHALHLSGDRDRQMQNFVDQALGLPSSSIEKIQETFRRLRDLFSSETLRLTPDLQRRINELEEHAVDAVRVAGIAPGQPAPQVAAGPQITPPSPPPSPPPEEQGQKKREREESLPPELAPPEKKPITQWHVKDTEEARQAAAGEEHGAIVTPPSTPPSPPPEEPQAVAAPQAAPTEKPASAQGRAIASADPSDRFRLLAEVPTGPKETVLLESSFGITPDLRTAFSPRSIEIQRDDSAKEPILGRDYYERFGKELPCPPVVIGKSSFVSDELMQFLMLHKTDAPGYAIKYDPKGVGGPGCIITPMEGCLHTFVTPVIGSVRMCGDYFYDDGFQCSCFGDKQYRQVILSAAIHPDCETAEDRPPSQPVFLKLVEVTEEPLAGSDKEVPVLTEDARSYAQEEYDRRLLQRQIYFLTSAHRRISTREVTREHDVTSAEARIEGLINAGATRTQIQDALRGEVVRLNERRFSLEIFYNSYMEQLQNELLVLEQLTGEDGYFYTIDPPSIFARQLGWDGPHILSLLQCLALKSLMPGLRKLRGIGMGGPAAPQRSKVIDLYNAGRKGPPLAIPKELMLDETRHFRADVLGRAALVIHNNSDAFYQNIKYEPSSSLDGVIGTYSNGYKGVDPVENKDITKRVIRTRVRAASR